VRHFVSISPCGLIRPGPSVQSIYHGRCLKDPDDVVEQCA
jgi:hypothetical protein